MKERPRLTSTDRLLWVSLSRICRHWRSTLVIVKPETVVAWHRKGFRLFWTWKVRHGQPGRPANTRETRDLIRRMCRENPTWGAPRIHGELLKLGIVIGESSVTKHMVRGRNRRLRPGLLSSRTTSHSLSPSISSLSPQSASRSCTCSWFWLTIVGAFFTST